MARHLDQVENESAQHSQDGIQHRQPGGSGGTRTAASHPWGFRASMITLIALISWFLIYELPPYMGLDPNQARIKLNSHFPMHYPVLVLHIASGSIAMITMCVQVIPWVRKHHPRIHRVSGRLYVFAGVLPSALMALTLNHLTPMWVSNLGTFMQSVLWLGTTALGWRAARQHRWAQHRRWMVYSFALVLANVWGLIAREIYVRHPVVDPNYLFETARWVGWVVNLAVAQWWLERTGMRFDGPRTSARQPSPASAAR